MRSSINGYGEWFNFTSILGLINAIKFRGCRQLVNELYSLKGMREIFTINFANTE